MSFAALGAVAPGAAHAADYPYPNAPDCTEYGSNDGCVADRWNFYQGQCTSWVAFRLNAVNGVSFHNHYKGVRWGNAANWDDAARSVGIRVDSKPAVGAVAHWNGRNHVAYVERVNSDGSIVLSDMNIDLHNKLRAGFTVRPGSAEWPERFLHIKDVQTATTASYKGKIVRNRDNGDAYLVRNDGRRYKIPTGGDYNAIKANGVPVVNLSSSEISKIPTGSGSARVRRVDEPSISGPTRWLTRHTNTSHGYGRDYTTTPSAAGKSYTTNQATWSISQPKGVYRVKAFIPHRHAVAKVTYRIYDGTRHVESVTIDQRQHYGFVTLTERTFSSGKVKVVQADNWGPGPYNATIGWDAVEAVPIR